MEDFLSKALELKPRLVQIRRQIHMYPELGYKEIRTSSLISKTLKSCGLSVKKGIAQTGVIGLLKGKKKGKTVAVRAEMDALPINEMNRKSYRSRNKGIMHACGHDAHIAMVLGTAMLLSNMKKNIPGQIKFIFQPNEETPPSGALSMISKGVLKNPPVNAILGMHINTDMDIGKIGIKYGLASSHIGKFRLTIIGKSTHVSRPNLGTDAILIASQVIKALNVNIKREIDPYIPFTLGIGIIKGGTATNVIADRVYIEGTTRMASTTEEKEIITILRRIIGNVCHAYKARFDFQYIPGPPPIISDKKLTDIVYESATRLLGKSKVKVFDYPSMGGDDFAYYLQKTPGVFFALGVRNKQKGIVYSGHNSKFDIDEDSLPIGTAVMANSVMSYLNKNSN